MNKDSQDVDSLAILAIIFTADYPPYGGQARIKRIIFRDLGFSRGEAF